MKKYKIRYVVMNRLASGVVSFECTIVQGPRGGLYALDAFSTQALLERAVGWEIAQILMRDKAKIVGKENIRYVSISAKQAQEQNAENTKEIASIYKKSAFKDVKRIIKNNSSDIDKMAEQLDKSFMQRM